MRPFKNDNNIPEEAKNGIWRLLEDNTIMLGSEKRKRYGNDETPQEVVKCRACERAFTSQEKRELRKCGSADVSVKLEPCGNKLDGVLEVRDPTRENRKVIDKRVGLGLEKRIQELESKVSGGSK